LDKKYSQQQIHLDLKVLIRDDMIKNSENHVWDFKKKLSKPQTTYATAASILEVNESHNLQNAKIPTFCKNKVISIKKE
jgi:hypothetical protein